MQNIIKILIDLKKELYRFDQAQQGDDVVLDITIVENGVPKDLAKEKVELIYINANNTVASVVGDNVVINGNNVKITCPRDCTRSYGIAKFQLRIVSTYQVSTFPLALTIVPGVSQGQQISQNIATIIEDLTKKNIECKETLDSLNAWVAAHGDIVAIDTRLTAAENNIGNHTSQLAEKANLINWELQNKIRTNKPIFTIIDDDGHMAVKEKLVPLANKYNFKFTSAIIGSWVEDSDPRHMRVNDIKDLYNMGHEIASHSYGHIHMDTTTESELKSDFERMGKFIKSMGINYSNLVYPFGARNDSAINVVRNYVRGARTTAYGINYAPIQTWDLRVINGSTTDYDTLSTDKERVQYLKNELDKAYQNKGWAIYASHIYMDGNNHEYIIEELVKYAQSLGMEIVTFNEGLNRFGNIIDIGRYFDYDVDSREYYVLGVNSEVRSSFNNVPLRRVADVSNSTPPNYFKLGDVYIRRVTYANKTGFPEKEGVLTVDLAGAIAYNQYATQTYEPVGTGRIYKRYALDSNAWSEWELITPMKVITGVTSSSAVTQFPNNTVSIFRVSYANRNGFPGNTPGILTTQRLFEDSYASQEYKQINNNDIYRRYWQVETNTWSEWTKVSAI